MSSKGDIDDKRMGYGSYTKVGLGGTGSSRRSALPVKGHGQDKRTGGFPKRKKGRKSKSSQARTFSQKEIDSLNKQRAAENLDNEHDSKKQKEIQAKKAATRAKNKAKASLKPGYRDRIMQHRLGKTTDLNPGSARTKKGAGSGTGRSSSRGGMGYVRGGGAR